MDGEAWVLEFWCYSIVLYTIRTSSIRQLQWYRALYDRTKIYAANPKSGNGVGKDGRGRVFEFWYYCIVLHTIRSGSMRRFQCHGAGNNSTKTHGATPKYGHGGGKAWLGTGFSVEWY
jgi:hypothetical protein